ncbi:hypothetical protein EDB19DRAFT_1899786 [Suillus lakei]|nr:hypothetical protein EDB19DRAFT_1899786 [Suillus lakei]
MSDDENHLSVEPSCKHSSSALHWGPHKRCRLCLTCCNPTLLTLPQIGLHQTPWFFMVDILVALCNYPALLTAGILQLKELQDSPIENYPADVHQEHRVFLELVDSYPGLLDHLTNGKDEDIIHVGELIGKGVSGVRGNDTKTLKSAILEWLSDHGFNHEVTGALLCPAGLDWSHVETKQNLKSSETAVHGDQCPMFLNAGHVYDPEDPWTGLLRSEILIFMRFQAHFMSPSSVDREPKAMHSGNAYLHGMKSMTKVSLAYIATQVW